METNYIKRVAWEVMQRPGGGAQLRIATVSEPGKDAWEGSTVVLDLPKDVRDLMISDLMGTL